MSKSENLMIRVDRPSKTVITRAARLRGISASDYVRSVVVAHARRDLEESKAHSLKLSAAEQRAFWAALNEPVSLTPRQRQLSRLMRGGR
ncbi:MAG: DUF1778 domain-containing protein [Myxococcaceae bacterium]|nr:DUF1778 domain-containing protein [Myxococcaceae bacterium]